jgi:DNA-directed RNA polymerase specialized sigma24 family protein
MATRGVGALPGLAGLRWRRRRVFALRAVGYSYTEIATKLRLTHRNVNRQLTRGRGEPR